MASRKNVHAQSFYFSVAVRVKILRGAAIICSRSDYTSLMPIPTGIILQERP